MDNQHKKIKGYRDLSQFEIDLMNKIKGQGVLLESMICDLESLPLSELSDKQSIDRIDALRYAKKDLKQGVMWAVRSVALPDSF